MDQTARIYRIELLLRERRVVPMKDFLDDLEISQATFKRDLEYMRDRLNAPVVWDRTERGYRFEKQGVGDKYELPGLWFSASEIHALLTMQELLKSLQPGLLTTHIEPLLSRLREILEREDMAVDTLEKRIRIQKMNARTYEHANFTPIATAVLQRRRLVIDHYNRSRGETIRREVSPQRLNYYRDNWYVDCLCHLRSELRSFALDAIKDVSLMDDSASEVPEKELNTVLDSGYGIFAGQQVDWAELRFTPERARWVQHETWHPKQVGSFAPDGHYHLRVPFSDMRELVMDIMRHVPEVTVVAPSALRERVLSQLKQGLAAIQPSTIE